DKRVNCASGASYPGKSQTEITIDQLARDAAAGARFLAGRAEVDPARIGLAGHSQAGWVMPLAAKREPGIRFLVVFSGSAVTADENDLYQTLAGEGDRPQRMTNAAIDARVEGAHLGGVDPAPWLGGIPLRALWLA